MQAAVDVKDLKWLLLGAIIGVGNFFYVPSELARVGALSFLFWHLISLLFLCSPLICAELMWGKWLRRPLYQSFQIVHPQMKYLSVVILLSVGFAFPSYIYSFSTFMVQGILFLANAFGVSKDYLSVEDYWFLPYVGSLVVAFASIWTLRLSRNSFARLMKYFVLASGLFSLIVAGEIIRQWGFTSHVNLLQKGFRETHFEDVLRISNFSFFSVTLCCGIFFVLVQWLPKKRNEEGGLIGLALFLALGDFLASFICYLLVAPFVLDGDPSVPSGVYLNWIPRSLIYLESGYGTMSLLIAAIFMMGFCAISVIFRVCAEHLEAGLGHERQKTMMRFSWWVVLALFLPIIPSIRSNMILFSSQVLMPVSGLIFALFVILKMPPKSQRLILGRGLVVDYLVTFWRYGMIFVVIPYVFISLIL